MSREMKIKVDRTYVFTEADARRLKNLSRILSLAVAELLEARCQESLIYARFDDSEECGQEADYDLHEMMTYEQAFEMRQALAADEPE